jgi:hypothetical protein
VGIRAGRLAAEARERLAEVQRAIVRGTAAGREVEPQHARIRLQQHRDRAGALGRLTRTAARVFGDVGRDHDGLPLRTVAGQIAQGALERVGAAQTGVLVLGHFAVASQRRLAERTQGVVEHAADDHGTGRIVRGRFRAEGQKADARRIDVMAQDEVEHGLGRQGVHALAGSTHAEPMADHGADLAPVVPGPIAPLLQVHAIPRHVDAQATEADGIAGHLISEGKVFRA